MLLLLVGWWLLLGETLLLEWDGWLGWRILILEVGSSVGLLLLAQLWLLVDGL